VSNDTRDTLNNIKDDVRDGADEAKHRAQATGEHLSRDVQGDDMSLTDRIASNVKEAGHNIAAEFDKTKRDVRHADTGSDTNVIKED
jgi:hypothetical protein